MQSISGVRSMSTLLFRSLNRSVSINRLLSFPPQDPFSSKISQIALNSVLNGRSVDRLAPDFDEAEMMNTIAIAEELFYQEKIESFLEALVKKEENLEFPFRAIAYRIFKDNQEDSDVSLEMETQMQKFFFWIAEAPLRYIAKETIKQILQCKNQEIAVKVNYSQAPKLFAEPKEGDSPVLQVSVEMAIVEAATKFFNNLPGLSAAQLTHHKAEKTLTVTLTFEEDEKRTREAFTAENFLQKLFRALFIDMSSVDSLNQEQRALLDRHENLIAELKGAIENKGAIEYYFKRLAQFYEEASQHLEVAELERLVKEGKVVMDVLYRDFAARLIAQIDIPPLRDLDVGDEIFLLNDYSQAVGNIAQVTGDTLSEMEVIAQAVISLNYQLASRYTITPSKWLREGEAQLCLNVVRDL